MMMRMMGPDLDSIRKVLQSFLAGHGITKSSRRNTKIPDNSLCGLEVDCLTDFVCVDLKSCLPIPPYCNKISGKQYAN